MNRLRALPPHFGDPAPRPRLVDQRAQIEDRVFPFTTLKAVTGRRTGDLATKVSAEVRELSKAIGGGA
jgi:hypothetical protein